MSREIKFRGLHKGAWVYGSYVTDYKDWHVIQHENPSDKSQMLNFEIAKESVGQLTGLKDINGTDIYEGDLLHELDPCQWQPAEVAFKDGAFEINLTSRTRYPVNAKYIAENELVFIGNIHQSNKGG